MHSVRNGYVTTCTGSLYCTKACKEKEEYRRKKERTIPGAPVFRYHNTAIESVRVFGDIHISITRTDSRVGVQYRICAMRETGCGYKCVGIVFVDSREEAEAEVKKLAGGNYVV